MGRAKNMGADLFSQVLGSSRGKSQNDSLAASQPTERAWQNLYETIAALEAGSDIIYVLQLLRQHPQVIEQHQGIRKRSDYPLLDRLCPALEKALGAYVLAEWQPVIQNYWNRIGARSSLSEKILIAPSKILHFWPEANYYGSLQSVLSDPTNQHLDVGCGSMKIEKAQKWIQAPRGTWQETFTNLDCRYRRCPKCESNYEDDEMDEKTGSLASGWWVETVQQEKLGRALLQALPEKISKEEDCLSSIETLNAVSDAAFITAVYLAEDDRETFVKRVLDGEYLGLRDRAKQAGYSAQLYLLLQEGDIREIMRRYLPTTTKSVISGNPADDLQQLLQKRLRERLES